MKLPVNRWFAFFTILMLILFSQCSNYTGKSVLRFFFDGVAESDSISSVLKDSTEAKPLIIPSSEIITASGAPELTHYPYAENACASCHDEQSLGTMVEPQPGLCYACHEDLTQKYNYLHGPVAGGYCTACHNPHRSANEMLLRLTGDELCHYCHEAASMKETETHEGLEGMPCMDCHNPHGGEDKYLFQ